MKHYYFFIKKFERIGGYFYCISCKKAFYLTARQISKRNECLCDNCIKNKDKPKKQKKIKCKKIKDKKIKKQRIKNVTITKKYKTIVYNNDYICHKKRKTLIEERGLTCESCGRSISISKHLHMHHIDRNRNNNTDDNLILLCATCHHKQHTDKKYISTMLHKQSVEF